MVLGSRFLLHGSLGSSSEMMIEGMELNSPNIIYIYVAILAQAENLLTSECTTCVSTSTLQLRQWKKEWCCTQTYGTKSLSRQESMIAEYVQNKLLSQSKHTVLLALHGTSIDWGTAQTSWTIILVWTVCVGRRAVHMYGPATNCMRSAFVPTF